MRDLRSGRRKGNRLSPNGAIEITGMVLPGPDAGFIVTACNNHEGLIATLDRILELTAAHSRNATLARKKRRGSKRRPCSPDAGGVDDGDLV